MQTAESSVGAYPLDERQQRRILDGVLAGPVLELLGEVARRLPEPPRRTADEADYLLAVQRRLHPMQVDIGLIDSSGRAGYKWPGTGLTGDDQRRLATMENTTRLRTTRLLHHSVRIAHHLFQAILREIMATSDRTGASVRDLLGIATGGNGHAIRAADFLIRDRSPGEADPDPASDDEPSGPDPEVADSTATSFPPPPMTKRTAGSAPVEGISEDRVRELEERMQRLESTMETLTAAIDEFREDLVHSLRNLPDRLPPPLHFHSMPLDPTDPDFPERVNGIPPNVMAQLRDEAVRGGAGDVATTTAAEGEPSPATVIEEPLGNGRPRGSRQTRLFA